jgi:hypothetical protein
MLTIRAMAAIAAIFAGAIMVAAPALAACDSIYSQTCQPIPSVDPPEAAAEPEKASKPLQINRRHATRKAARERTAQVQRKRFGKKAGTQRVLTLRQKRATALAAKSRERVKPAAILAEDEVQDSPPLPPARSVRAPRRTVASADPSASSGEATDLNAATDVLRAQPVVTVPVANPVEQARPAPAPAAGPAPIPVPTVSQSEVNEIDLAAATASPDPADQSWIRTLVLAFGGLLAVGSALRLFL